MELIFDIFLARLHVLKLVVNRVDITLQLKLAFTGPALEHAHMSQRMTSQLLVFMIALEVLFTPPQKVVEDSLVVRFLALQSSLRK